MANALLSPYKPANALNLQNLYFNAPAPNNLTAPRYTAGERVANFVERKARDLGLSKHIAKRLAALPEFSPVGAATAAFQAGSDLRQSKYESAAVNAVGAALSALPDGGAMAGKVAHSIIAPLFHGSPHKFEKFALEKIGTGEGAQAYGHGLYFAENRDVAEGYKQALTQRHAKTTFDGRELAEPKDWWKLQDELEAAGKWRQRKALDLVDSWKRQGYDLDATGNILRNEYRNQPDMLSAIDEILPKVEVRRPDGALYEVSLDANPEDFLNWDAPLHEQPQAVQNAVLPGVDVRGLADELADLSRRKDILAADRLPSNQMRDEQGWHALARQSEAIQQRLSIAQDGRTAYGYLDGAPIPVGSPYTRLGRMKAPQMLMDNGVQGIRYLDQGSRGAGQGTSNYVVFDPEIIEIMNRL